MILAASFPPHAPTPNRRLSIEWQKAMPKWQMLLAMGAQFAVILWLVSFVTEQARANAENVTKAELRLAERVAVNESETRTVKDLLRASLLNQESDRKERQAYEVQMWKVATDLTWQVKVLTEKLTEFSQQLKNDRRERQ